MLAVSLAGSAFAAALKEHGADLTDYVGAYLVTRTNDLVDREPFDLDDPDALVLRVDLSKSAPLRASDPTPVDLARDAAEVAEYPDLTASILAGADKLFPDAAFEPERLGMASQVVADSLHLRSVMPDCAGLHDAVARVQRHLADLSDLPEHIKDRPGLVRHMAALAQELAATSAHLPAAD